MNRFRPEAMAVGIPIGTTLVFTFVFWTLLWRRSVRWTVRGGYSCLMWLRRRARRSAAWSLWARRIHMIGYRFSCWRGLLCLAYLVTTVIVWQETPLERANRVRISNRSAVTCPACGYNLTGLSGSTVSGVWGEVYVG